MRSAHSTGPVRMHRDPVILAAWILLGIFALLEIVLAAIPLAPRIAGGFRAAAAVRDPQDPAAGNGSVRGGDTFSGSPLPPTPFPSPVPDHEITSFSRPQNAVLGSADLPARQPPPDSAMPGGAVLQIVSDHLESTGDGPRKLQIAIKADQHQTIQVSEVKVQVYFYDEENGDIAPSKAQVTSSWLSLPVNWRKGTPELLEVSYLPDAADGNVRFAGYVVAIYYKGDLQDCRANPPKLRKMFEPKYFIGNDEP